MLWHCLACTTAYAVGLPACPHCRSTSKEEDVPKTHVEGGPSYAGHVDVSSPDTVTPEWAPAAEVVPDIPADIPAAEPEPEPLATRRRTRKQ